MYLSKEVANCFLSCYHRNLTQIFSITKYYRHEYCSDECLTLKIQSPLHKHHQHLSLTLNELVLYVQGCQRLLFAGPDCPYDISVAHTWVCLCVPAAWLHTGALISWFVNILGLSNILFSMGSLLKYLQIFEKFQNIKNICKIKALFNRTHRNNKRIAWKSIVKFHI